MYNYNKNYTENWCFPSATQNDCKKYIKQEQNNYENQIMN